MEHRGEILRTILTELGMSQRKLATKLKRHHNTVATYLERPDLKDDLLLEIGRILRVDMGTYYPSLAKHAAPALAPEAARVEEPSIPYMSTLTAHVPETLSACQQALMMLQAQHINLAHDYINLLRQVGLQNVA